MPIENMVYIAHGPSDVPFFRLEPIRSQNFRRVHPTPTKSFVQVAGLQEQGRARGVGPANYRPGSHAARWLSYWVETIATNVADRRQRALGQTLGKPPKHIVEAPPAAEAPQDELARTIAQQREVSSNEESSAEGSG